MSGRSKGMGYIEFADKAAIEHALLLSGTLFMKHTVLVQASQAEKNRVPEVPKLPTAPGVPGHLAHLGAA